MDVILVVLDRFAKMAYFILCSKTNDVKLCFKKLCNCMNCQYLPCPSKMFKFKSYFWKTESFWHTPFKYSFCFHPLMDNQNEAVNHSPNSIIRGIIGKRIRIETYFDLLLNFHIIILLMYKCPKLFWKLNSSPCW